jgi:hypothetical protein
MKPQTEIPTEKDTTVHNITDTNNEDVMTAVAVPNNRTAREPKTQEKDTYASVVRSNRNKMTAHNWVNIVQDYNNVDTEMHGKTECESKEIQKETELSPHAQEYIPQGHIDDGEQDTPQLREELVAKLVNVFSQRLREIRREKKKRKTSPRNE